MNKALKVAAENGHLDVVKLLNDQSTSKVDADNTVEMYKALVVAAENGHLDVVKFLNEHLRKGDADNTVEMNKALVVAAENSHLDVVKYLLDDPRVTPSAEAVVKAIQSKHVKIISCILDKLNISNSDYSIREDLEDHEPELTYSDCECECHDEYENEKTEEFVDDCSNGYLKGVKETLYCLDTEILDKKNEAIFNASSSGHTEIVRLLLSDTRFDPSDQDNACIRAANNVKIVRYLLGVTRVDPAAKDNQALKYACRYKSLEIVRLLLADPRVDTNPGDENECLFESAKRGRVKIVDALIKKRTLGIIETTPVSENLDEQFLDACWFGETEVVRKLLKERRLNPIKASEALIYACVNGHVEIVKLCIADWRIDPAYDSNMAFRKACEFEHLSIVRLLLKETNKSVICKRGA